MVCQKAVDSEVDCEKDPLDIRTDGKKVYAEGTSLGADNGIGIAISLAALVSEDLTHGPLEVLMTVDEETGLTGALKLKKGFFTGDYLLNIDSETLGEITISSAGGGDTILTLPTEKGSVKNRKGFRLAISGLQGGHSGIDIDKDRLNAIKIGVDALRRVEDYLNEKRDENLKLLISSISGGTVHNAIPSDFTCDFLVPKGYQNLVLKVLSNWRDFSKSTLKELEPNAKIEIAEIKGKETFSAVQTANILELITEMHHGVISHSNKVEGLVQTSNNLATVKTLDDKVEIAVSTRSSVDAELKQVRERVKQLGESLGAEVSFTEAYPGWTPNLESPFLKMVKRNYEEVLENEVEMKAVHAGLECGLFMKTKPNLNISSIGPTIRNVHSTEEYVEVESVRVIWKVVKKIILSMEELA
jgi:dipeptidase D